MTILGGCGYVRVSVNVSVDQTTVHMGEGEKQLKYGVLRNESKRN
jgi:hypothetical protein